MLGATFFLSLVAALVLPATTLATDSQWQGNGYPSATCQPGSTGTMLWVWTGDSPTSLTINGNTYTGWVQQGGGSWHLTVDIVPGTNYPPVEGSGTFVSFTGNAGTLTLSHCDPGAEPTPTPTTEPTPTPTGGTAPDLTIDKSNNAPLVNEIPTEDEGATVTYTLDYHLTNGPVHDGTIADVLPAGVTYVTGSATSNAEFTFDGYDAGTRTLTWLATEVTVDGSLSYKATVDAGAAALVQPLTNTACISSEETDKVCDGTDVFVAPPPLAETSVPKTAPPTDTLGSNDSTTSSPSMLLVLLGLAGIALAVAFVAPTPASIRKRMR